MMLPQFHTSWGWVTGTVYFNRDETWRLSNAWFVILMAALLPPPFNGILAVYSGYIAYSASWAYHYGRCLSVRSTADSRFYGPGGWCR